MLPMMLGTSRAQVPVRRSRNPLAWAITAASVAWLVTSGGDAHWANAEAERVPPRAEAVVDLVEADRTRLTLLREIGRAHV